MTCDICSKRVKTSNSSTSNLFGHLSTHHPIQYQSIAPSGIKRKMRDIPFNQKTIKETFERHNKYSKGSPRHQEITSAVTSYITSGSVPIYTVEKKSFKDLLYVLDPRYELPHRNHFSSYAIPEQYNLLKNKVVEELKKVEYIALTMDGWTSLARDSYVSLTSHFIDHEWRLKTQCLTTAYLPESHTGQNLANFVKDGLAEYGFTIGRVTTMTTDNGTNMISACEKLQLLRLSCFGHILHNAITGALNSQQPVVDVISKSRKIVSVFSHSSLFRQRLLKVQKELNLPQQQLVNDVATRWGSKHAMLSRLSLHLPAFTKLFGDSKWFVVLCSFLL